MTKSKKSTPTQSNRVLGVDPGFDRLGIAILEKDGVLFSTCVETSRKLSHHARLLEIGEALRKIIGEWEPSCLAIESLLFNQNVGSALKVAEARGIILYEAARAELEVYEYSPQAVKIAVTGYGKADKKQVESMARKLVKLGDGKKLDDEIDAIALGITHIATKKYI